MCLDVSEIVLQLCKIGKGVSYIFCVEDILTLILDTIFREIYRLLIP